MLPTTLIVLALASLSVGAEDFRRGDANGDGAIDLSDSVRVLFGLFGGERLPCEDAADLDDSGVLDLSDAIYGLAYMFLGGPAPLSPGLACGFDPISDPLGCDRHPPCDVPDLT